MTMKVPVRPIPALEEGEKKKPKQGNVIVLLFLNEHQNPSQRRSLELGDRRLPNYSQGFPNYTRVKPETSEEGQKSALLSLSVSKHP